MFWRTLANVAKNWAKLEMVKQTFPHTLCVVSTSDETTLCGICLKKPALGIGEGSLCQKLHFFGTMFTLKIRVLLGKYFKSRLTIKNLFTWLQNIILPINKNVINFSLGPTRVWGKEKRLHFPSLALLKQAWLNKRVRPVGPECGEASLIKCCPGRGVLPYMDYIGMCCWKG